MEQGSTSILSAALVLFFVMDPLGNVPLFVSYLRHVDEKRRTRVLAREVAIAGCVLLVFLFGGDGLLHVLHLEQESVTIGGGIVLMIIALRMVFPQQESSRRPESKEEPFIVPLAIPLLAGPSALATLILMVRSDPDAVITRWLPALGIAWGASAAILMASPILIRVLKKRGLTAIERLMGMILIMIAVQMVMTGIREFMTTT